METNGDDKMYKALIAGIVGLGLLSGCIKSPPQPFYLKTGSTSQEHNRILLKCEVEAAQKIPVSNQASTTPVFTTPTYTTPVSCYSGYGGYVTCSGGQTTGGQTYGGNVVISDANLGLRQRLQDQCMADKGYILRNLKPCSDLAMADGENFPLSGKQPETDYIECFTQNQGFIVLPPA